MLGICWEYISNSWNFYINFSQELSRNINPTLARGVQLRVLQTSSYVTWGLVLSSILGICWEYVVNMLEKKCNNKFNLQLGQI